jgi:hypothetical protein
MPSIYGDLEIFTISAIYAYIHHYAKEECMKSHCDTKTGTEKRPCDEPGARRAWQWDYPAITV